MTRLRSTFALITCAMFLGLSFVLIRATTPSVGPFGVTAFRTFIGGLILVAFGARAHQPIRIRDWSAYLVLGALSAAIPFTLMSMAMGIIDSGTAAVLNTAGPMFAVGLDAFVQRRWPSPSTAVGLATATTGVVLVVGTRGVHLAQHDLVGVGLALAGACIFAYAGFFAARRFPTGEPLAVAAGQQIAACVLAAPVAAALWPNNPRIEPTIIVQLLVLGVFGGAVAYLLFYRLIAMHGPVFAANVNLLIPVWGILWGWLLLKERIPATSFAGMALVVGGLGFVLWRADLSRRSADRSLHQIERLRAAEPAHPEPSLPSRLDQRGGPTPPP
jgi:drug/metabolite transporter (DMT)-like permease